MGARPRGLPCLASLLLCLAGLLIGGASGLEAQLGYGEALSYPVSPSPNVLIAVDLDGDLDLDLAAAEPAGVLSILLNLGNGTYQTASEHDLGLSPLSPLRGLAAGDFDGDGDPDLAFGWAQSAVGDGQVSILPNLGGGVFGQRQDHPIAGVSTLTPFGVTAADLDGDGDVDVALAANWMSVAGQPSFFSVLWNQGVDPQGDVVLSPAESFQASSFAWDITSADFDNDGDTDLALANRPSDRISVLLNSGGGGFGPALNFVLESGATGPFVILPGDLDGDGFVDLATVNWFSGSVSIFLNNGNGTFNDTGDVVVTQNGFGVPGRGAIGDLDGDGDLDIAVPFSGGFLVVIFNDGLADFPDQQVIAAGSGPSAVELAHLDGDSQLDIAVVRTGTGRAAILLTRDVGTLSLGSNAGAAGATVEIPVAVTQNRPLSGLSFGLLHDPGLLTPLTVLPGRVLDSAQGGIDPGLFLVDLSPAGGGGVTVECVVDPGPIPIVELAAGVEQEAVVCGYAISAAAGPVATPLAFTSTLGAPPVPVSMTLEGGPVLPVTTGGTVEIFVEADFIRGDSNGSGGLNLADVVLNLNRMFGNLPPSACWGADDVNGSGSVNLSDAVYLLSYLFSGGPEPQAPFPGCAATPDPGSTPACVLFSGCP